MDPNKKIIIIDCSALAHRVKHTMKGIEYEFMPTGVVFGFMMKLLQLSKKFNSNQFVFAFDSDRRTYKRKKIYSDYKNHTNKPKMTKEDKLLNSACYNQLKQLKTEILPKIGFVNLFRKKGYEADDIIASIVQNNKGEFIIFSGDEDMYQLLNYADLYKPKKGLYTKFDFIEEYKIMPSKWYKVKAISGCNSDAVPGVFGVGEKTAIKFLKKECSLKTKQKILDHKEIINRNIKLVKLPLKGLKPIFLKSGEILDLGNFIDVCMSLNFQSFLYGEQLNTWEKSFGFINKNYTECPF